jgi:hypothetical protein
MDARQFLHKRCVVDSKPCFRARSWRCHPASRIIFIGKTFAEVLPLQRMRVMLEINPHASAAFDHL